MTAILPVIWKYMDITGNYCYLYRLVNGLISTKLPLYWTNPLYTYSNPCSKYSFLSRLQGRHNTDFHTWFAYYGHIVSVKRDVFTLLAKHFEHKFHIFFFLFFCDDKKAY